MIKVTLDGYEYEVLKTSKKSGLPTIKNKKYIRYLDNNEVCVINRNSIKNNTFNRINLVYGIGINDSTEKSDQVLIDKWKGIIGRVRGPELGYTSLNNQKVIDSYVGVEVQESWLIFSNFEKWASTKNYKDKDLDKDLLGTGTLYSEDTCCFLPHYLNSVITVQHKGDVPYLGVQRDGPHGKYKVTPHLYGKKINVKRFSCALEAHRYWQETKVKIITTVASDYYQSGDICKKIYEAFIVKINKLQYELTNNLITNSI